MRRVLLGGLGLALGVLARPALAQDDPGRSPPPSHTAPAQPDPVKRAAGLGRPVAIPDGNPTDGVTPAGMLARGQVQPAVVPPPTGVVPGYGYSAQPMATPLPPPRPVGGMPPMVTEVRDPMAGLGAPSAAGGGVLVPSVGPVVGGIDCPQPCLDDPLYGRPGMGPVNRLFGATNNRFWVSGEYLMWWTRSAALPTLVTTSSPQFFGIPGQGNTSSVLSGSFGTTLHGGARFGAGYWFGDDQVRGIDTRFFFLFRNGTSFTTNTDQYPLLARPFYNVNAPVGPFSEVIGAPGLAVGRVAVDLNNSVWGAEVNYRRALASNGCARLAGLVGFRYMNLTEDLTITESFTRTPNSPLTVGVPASSGLIMDRFRTENNFYGGQIGLTGEVRRGRWFVDGRASIAFGTVSQSVEIAGNQALNFPNGTTQYAAGGLLAVPGANIGTYRQNKFAVLPELGLNVGYQVTPHMRVFVGYNFLYLSNVLRASDAIDPVLDAARIPNFPLPGNPAPIAGFNRPAPAIHTSDFWAQGISFGLQFNW